MKIVKTTRNNRKELLVVKNLFDTFDKKFMLLFRILILRQKNYIATRNKFAESDFGYYISSTLGRNLKWHCNNNAE